MVSLELDQDFLHLSVRTCGTQEEIPHINVFSAGDPGDPQLFDHTCTTRGSPGIVSGFPDTALDRILIKPGLQCIYKWCLKRHMNHNLC